MNRNLSLLAERRERLVAQSTNQRAGLVKDIMALRTPLAFADRVVVVARFIKRHPAILVGGSIMLAALLRRYARKWPFLWAGLQLGRNLFMK